MKTATVDIYDDGEIQVDLAGFKGKGCKAVADAFTKDDKVVSETAKPEFNQQGNVNGNLLMGQR